MLKNNKIRKREFSLEVTIHCRGKYKGLNILPNTDDQKPKSTVRLREDPGGAIHKI